MTRSLVKIGRFVYRATPFRQVRQFYFAAFCYVMRGREVRATINGATFDLNLGEMIDVAIFLDQYEPDVRAALRQYCKPGMTVLDIGANVGAHSFAMASLVSPAGSVYAFEPTDFAFKKLSANVALNHGVPVHAVKTALSDQTIASQSIDYRASWQTRGGRNDRGSVVVDFTRLDDWCARTSVTDVGLIKIDIDGNEFGALSGGIDLLRRCRPVIIIEAGWPHFADESRNPYSLLAELGYSFRDARTGREFPDVAAVARLFPFEDPEMTTSLNVIATPTGPARGTGRASAG